MTANHPMGSNPLVTRREMLGITGMAGLSALAGSAPGAAPQTQQTRPRIACCASFWGAPGSHADWIICKLMDGYWWQGTHTSSRVDVVSTYIHQFDTSGRYLGSLPIDYQKGAPMGLTVDREGFLYLVTNNGKVLKYQLTGK